MSVASLQLGQRVYVLRDADGEPVGAWGTVAREKWNRSQAWVRLDVRHARCPFPADLELRATWILTSPADCSSVAPEATTERRPAGCLCTWEFGDSECPVHPTCPGCGCTECECSRC